MYTSTCHNICNLYHNNISILHRVHAIIYTYYNIHHTYYTRSGNLNGAKDLLKKTEEEAIKVFGHDSYQHGKVLNSLAVCYEKLDNLPEAVTTLTLALSLQNFINTTNIDELLLVSNTYYNLALLYNKLEQYSDALIQFNMSYRIKKEQLKLPDSEDDMTVLKEYISEVSTKAK